MSNNGFGSWQFSDRMVPTVKDFAARYHRQEYSSEGFNPWRLLFAYEDMQAPQISHPMDAQNSEIFFDDDDFEDSTSISETINQANQNLDQLKDPAQHVPQPELTNTEPEATLALSPQAMPVTVHQRESQLDESDLPDISLQETAVDKGGEAEGEGVADLVELLESGAKELDLTTLPTTTLVEIFREVNDKGLCHAVEAVCSMKHTDQARFCSTIITYLLLPRLHESKPRCNRQVQTAFCQFLGCSLVLSCRLLLVPLLVNVSAQHTDIVRKLLTQVNSQPHKNIVLKGVVESLSELSEPHLSLFLLLIGPTEDNQVKQQFIKLLSDSADKFMKDIKFGKLLLAVIPHFASQPDLTDQLVYIVNRHQSLVKKSALKLLNR